MSGVIKSSITFEGVVTPVVRAVGQCTLQIVTTEIRFAHRTQIKATRLDYLLGHGRRSQGFASHLKRHGWSIDT
ncbi:hypothetical protein N9383_05960, partial [Granulosicoccus sp.]|nr:hypothetical protein [Granulosicoccus sp.]